eukprot:g4746.t1
MYSSTVNVVRDTQGNDRAKKRIMVTGGAGFIGSYTSEALLARGDDVVIVDEMNDYYDTSIKFGNVERLQKKYGKDRCRFVKGDICDNNLLRKAFDGVDGVCHLAARAGVRPSIAEPFLYIRSNIVGTTNIFEEARRAGIRHVVYASSSSVYGGSKKESFRETDREDIFPVSQYAATKKACELFAHTYYHLYGIESTGLRFFTVYGPRGRPDMAAYKFVSRIANGAAIDRYGDGSSERDWTFVTDIVDGILRSLDRPLGYKVFNLGNGSPIRLSTFIDLAHREVERGLGRHVELNIRQKPDQPGDVPRTCADISLAQRFLAYAPKVKLEEGLRRTVEWYLKSKKNIEEEEEEEEEEGGDEMAHGNLFDEEDALSLGSEGDDDSGCGGGSGGERKGESKCSSPETLCLDRSVLDKVKMTNENEQDLDRVGLLSPCYGKHGRRESVMFVVDPFEMCGDMGRFDSVTKVSTNAHELLERLSRNERDSFESNSTSSEGEMGMDEEEEEHGRQASNSSNTVTWNRFGRPMCRENDCASSSSWTTSSFLNKKGIALPSLYLNELSSDSDEEDGDDSTATVNPPHLHGRAPLCPVRTTHFTSAFASEVALHSIDKSTLDQDAIRRLPSKYVNFESDVDGDDEGEDTTDREALRRLPSEYVDFDSDEEGEEDSTPATKRSTLVSSAMASVSTGIVEGLTVGCRIYRSSAASERIARRQSSATTSADVPADLVRLRKFVCHAATFANHVVIAVGSAGPRGRALCRDVESMCADMSKQLKCDVSCVAVERWGNVVPALNALVDAAVKKQSTKLLLASAEITLTSRGARLLCDEIQDSSLVAGACLNGHKFDPRVASSSFPIDATRIPWNTCAVWNLPRLALTGFLRVSECFDECYGMEEMSVLALHQRVWPSQSRAKLVRVPDMDVRWNVRDLKGDERRQYHRKKMASKVSRASKQLERFGATFSSGDCRAVVIEHVQVLA